MEDNNVVTKSELKNFQLITKLEDTVQALTDAKKQTDTDNAQLAEQNDKLKKENVKLSELNNTLILEISDLKRKCEIIKAESDGHISSKEIGLKAANEKILAQNEILFQKQNLEAELKTANEKVLAQNQFILQKQRENDFLKFLTKPLITDEDLVSVGATVDKWNGTAISNNVNLKRQFMKNAWSIVY